MASLWIRMGGSYDGRPAYPMSYNFENPGAARGVAGAIRGGGPLSGREVIRIMGGKDSRTLYKWCEVSVHIAADSMWRSTPSIIGYRVFQNFTKL